MPEYTIKVVYEMNYHFHLENADGIESIPDLDLDDLGNGQMIVNLADAAAFVLYVYGICNRFRDVYDMAHNKDIDTIREGLWTEYGINLERSSDDEDDEDNEDADLPPYQDYTYSQIEYEINGEEATITLRDTITDSDYAYVGVILESSEQTELREQYERERREQRERDRQDLLENSDDLVVRQRARAQYVDKLVDGEEYKILKIGQTLTFEEFSNLGKYYIERRLIYDNFSVDAEEVGCMSGIAYENVELPVRTNYGNIYCVKFLQEWINTGKQSDPNTGLDIETIYIMSEDDIKERELKDLKDQLETLETKIKNEKGRQKDVKGNERALELRRKIIQLQQEYKKLPKNKKEHGIAKAERTKLDRLLEQPSQSLQALKF